jgi:hypothetical protein
LNVVPIKSESASARPQEFYRVPHRNELRYHFNGRQARHTIVPVVIGEGIVCAIGVWLGRIGAN